MAGCWGFTPFLSFLSINHKLCPLTEKPSLLVFRLCIDRPRKCRDTCIQQLTLPGPKPMLCGTINICRAGQEPP